MQVQRRSGRTLLDEFWHPAGYWTDEQSLLSLCALCCRGFVKGAQLGKHLPEEKETVWAARLTLQTIVDVAGRGVPQARMQRR